MKPPVNVISVTVTRYFRHTPHFPLGNMAISNTHKEVRGDSDSDLFVPLDERRLLGNLSHTQQPLKDLNGQ